jgi:hypothetical protein
MAAVSSLFTLFNANEQRLTASLDGFERGLTDVMRGLSNALIDTPNWDYISGKLGVRSIIHTQQQLRAELNQLGYDDLVQKFMTNGYVPSEVFAETIYGALGKSELNLVPMRSDILTQLKQYDFSQYQEFGNRAIQETSKQLVMNTIGGKKRSAVIKDIQESLGIKVDQARVLADTSLRSFDRQCQWQTAKEAGADLFRYGGPKDLKNRPFCAEHAGKEYTGAQIAKMNNGQKQFGNVKLYMGGARCRHYWLPIVSPE